jgi:NAD(P)-dependent dehydrogenase (short-subunit alcohol dehydrogenase family)
MRLDGRHALITGGLGTIGRAITAAFREAGARVTLLDRPELEPPEGYGWLPTDLRDPKVAEGAVGTAGPFDILVNNAALIINKPYEAFSLDSLEEYEEQIRVNSTAAFALARAVAPAMKLQRLHSPNLIRLQATVRTH